MTQQEFNELDYETHSDKGYENQANGIAFERKIWNIEKRNSILPPILSSGSRSPIDIVSFRKNYTLLITCKKNGYLDPRERRALDKVIADAPKFCRVQLCFQRKRKICRRYY